MSVDIEHGRALLAAATPGPYMVKDLSDDGFNSDNGRGWWWVWRAEGDGYQGVLDMCHDYSDETGRVPGAIGEAMITDTSDGDAERADAELIVWLVNNAAALLSEVERLRATPGEIAAAIEADEGWIGPGRDAWAVAAGIAREWKPTPPARNPESRGGGT